MKNLKNSFLVCCCVFLFAVVYGGEKSADPLRDAAQDGDVSAQLKLANEFFFGVNRPGNLQLAVYWFRIAAGGGSAEAQYDLGMCYLKGWGVARSERMAYLWLEKAADKIPDAAVQAAVLEYRGVPAEENESGRFSELPASPESAVAKLEKLADEKVLSACCEYAALLYQNEKTREEKGEKIFSLLQSAAKEERCSVQTLMLYALCLQDGVGCVPDMKGAAAVLERAAATGDPEALTRLSITLDDGFGCPRDPQRALALLQQAVKKNSPRAMVRLGKCYLLGEVVPHDPAVALQLFERAAAMQYPSAWRELGICYSAGIGVEKDAGKAFAFFEKSARAGDGEGAYLLAIAFRDGIGVDADPEGAFFWFRSAATLGHPGATRETGIALIEGRGVARDDKAGQAFLAEAAKRGDPIARRIIEAGGTK